MLTLQEISNKVVAGLASQGFHQSINTSDYSCLYHGDEGRKCAVGHLFNDDAYIESFEGTNFENNRQLWEALQENDVDVGEHQLFLAKLQQAHDGGYSPNVMKKYLRKAIKNAHLNVPKELDDGEHIC